MAKSVRSVFFWVHLAVGVTVGLIVAVMSATGAALAFEDQILDAIEHDSGQIVLPTPSDAKQRLTFDEMLARVKATRPGVAITAVAISPRADRAVRVSLGSDVVFVDPYRGDVIPAAGAGVRTLLATLLRWHRFLGAEGSGRDVGRAITGAGNAGFLFLVVSGLVLWWPRRWSARAVRATIWFRRGLHGRVRDFNWHNVIGFWSLPVLLVVTFSGLMISYRPVANLIFRVAGETPPAGSGPGGAPPVKVPKPAAGTHALGLEALLATARAQVPDWTGMSLRLGGGGGRGRGGDGPAPVTVAVKSPTAGPRFASVNLTLDPFTARVLKDDRFANQGPGRRARSWLRFLHTGEALGPFGQFLAGLASLGSLVLVYTGFALSLRRFRARARKETGQASGKDSSSLAVPAATPTQPATASLPPTAPPAPG